MIVVEFADRKFELRWLGGAWRDKAGHVWEMSGNGTLSCKTHGVTGTQDWKVQ